MNVSLTKKQEDYIANQIKSGDFQNASELVRDALRLHQVYRNKMIKDLRKEIQSGVAEPTVSYSLKKTEKLTSEQKEMLELSEQDIEAGKLISQEAMKNRNLEWLNEK